MQNDNQGQDVEGQIDFNPSLIFEKLDAWLDGFIRLLPNLVMALILFIIIYFSARAVSNLVRKTFVKRDRANLGVILGSFIRWIMTVLGLMICATIVIPSINPGDLIAGLGVSSVAIGFAFKDILQNWLAGLLILLRQPFEIGDQIKVSDHEGTVERIETRATMIKTYDGELVVIPNSDIYTSAIDVKTAFSLRRSQYDIGVGYGDSIEDACQVIKEAILEVEGVDTQNGVDALPWDLAASWITIRTRWWTQSDRASVVKVKAEVIHAVKKALDKASIDMPYETQVHLFHDQTEETDGDRSQQREGWPQNGDDASVPRWKKELEMASEEK